MQTITERFLWLLDQLTIMGEVDSPADLARKIGVGSQNITNIKAGRNGVGPNLARKILDAFKFINSPWFYEGHGKPFADTYSKSADVRAMERLMAKYGLKSLADQIRELHTLHLEGIITKAEFNGGKKKILR